LKVLGKAAHVCSVINYKNTKVTLCNAVMYFLQI